MSLFYWGKRQGQAARLLAEGKRHVAVAEAAGVTVRTIQRWVATPEFAAEVDRLTLLTGMAVRAERVRQAKRIVEDLGDKTTKDLLDWLKFIQSETDGTKFDADFLAQIVAAVGSAGDGQPGAAAESGDGAASGGDAGEGSRGAHPVDGVAPVAGASDDGAGEQGG